MMPEWIAIVVMCLGWIALAIYTHWIREDLDHLGSHPWLKYHYDERKEGRAPSLKPDPPEEKEEKV